MEKILLVEDDYNFGSVLKSYLELNNYLVTLCTTGDKGYSALKTDHFDLCIFDVMLPGMDGFRLAEEKQHFKKDIPFIFLTAKTLKEDMVKGFNLGADDYITKPFDTDLLLLKIKAVLQRYNKKNDILADIYTFGSFTFTHSLRTLHSQVTNLVLSPREADVLRLLCVYKNQLLTKDMVLHQIWGDNSYFNARSLDVFIAKLRKYISHDTSVKIISVHGSGYRFLVGD